MAIEVEGPGGVVVEFPDGTTTSVMQRAMAARFPAPNAPKPTTRPRSSTPGENIVSNSQAQSVWDSASARLESKIAHLPESTKRKAREAFAADPAIQRLRGNISDGTRLKDPLIRQRMKQNAGDRADQQVKESGNFLTALSGGVKRGPFGIPEHLAAAATRFLPSAITGNDSDASYGEILQQVRDNTDAELEKSLPGNILGQIAGGGAALKGVELLANGTKLGRAAIAAAQASKPGKAIAAAAKVAPKTAKVAGMSAAGGATGLAQALGEGSDKSTGLAIGAVGGPVLLGLAKSGKAAGKLLVRPAADFLGITKAGTILKRFTTATVDDIRKAADTYRKSTGSEPTLFELLPLADRNKLARDIVGRTPVASEQAAAAVRQRVGNVGPEMQRTAQKATEAGRATVTRELAQDLERARSVPNAPGQPDTLDYNGLPVKATKSPIDMKDFQKAEANAVMAPHEDTQVADTLQDVFPKSLVRDEKTGDIREVFSDPEVNNALTAASGGLKLRLSPENPAAAVAGLTVNDMTKMLRQLAKVDPSAPNKAAAMRAEEILMAQIAGKSPEAAAAVGKMRDTFARRARMVEGMAEGGRTRTRESIPVEDSAQARKIRNAFDSDEGSAGRMVGQANALERELGGTTQDALRTTGNIAESGQTQAALRGNLGDEAAAKITGAAEAQSQSVRNLAALSRETSNPTESLGTEEIGRMLLALNPASMPTTKLFALSRITSLMHLPERRAKQLVDMLFSQDAAMTNRAIGLLNRAGNPGREALQAISRGARAGLMMEQGFGDGVDDNQGSPVPDASAADTMPVDDGGNPIEDAPQQAGSYGELLADWEANEYPEIVDLIARQSGQESQGRQFDDDGNPLESSAGAIGVMQVMPDTAPEAAELAGLPWDEEAYYQDPAYNKLLGIAYMKEMLRRYDGDVKLALAAYNAGPGAVDQAGGVPNYAETRNYVDRITR